MKGLYLWLAIAAGLAMLSVHDHDDGATAAACDAGCAPRSVSMASPIVDVPPALRTSNWGGGSCVHASTVHLLHWQGQHELAAWWRGAYRGGEHASRLHKRLDAARLRYAYTVHGDVAFLEWAIRTRRGAGITYFPNHAVNLVHLDAEWAGILDNNRVDEIIWIPRAEFLARWKAYGGWAWTLVYDPPPPVPYLNLSSL